MEIPILSHTAVSATSHSLQESDAGACLSFYLWSAILLLVISRREIYLFFSLLHPTSSTATLSLGFRGKYKNDKGMFGVIYKTS